MPLYVMCHSQLGAWTEWSQDRGRGLGAEQRPEAQERFLVLGLAGRVERSPRVKLTWPCPLGETSVGGCGEQGQGREIALLFCF